MYVFYGWIEVLFHFVDSEFSKKIFSIKLEVVRANWKADRDTLEEFGTILGYKKEDFNEDLLRKLDTVLCDKIDGLDDLVLKKSNTVLDLLKIENLKNRFLEKIDTVLFSKIGESDKALFDKIDAVIECLDMFIGFYKYIESPILAFIN